MLGQRIGRHAGEKQVSRRADHADEQAVEYVPGQRHPEARGHQIQLDEIIEGGAADKEPRRENEDLIERLERRNDSIKDGEHEKDAEYQQEQEHQNIAADRAVDMTLKNPVRHVYRPLIRAKPF